MPKEPETEVSIRDTAKRRGRVDRETERRIESASRFPGSGEKLASLENSPLEWVPYDSLVTQKDSSEDKQVEMSLVNVTSVKIFRNPSAITDPFEFEISFECLQSLEEDLEWKIVYISCAESKEMDQELDCIALGPITRGALKFIFKAPAPDFAKIPPEDIHGMAVVLILGSYRNEEFIRIGYYVHNVYTDPLLEDNPPDIPILDKLQRIVLSESPRLTRFNISWDSRHEEQANSQKSLNNDSQDSVSSELPPSPDRSSQSQESLSSNPKLASSQFSASQLGGPGTLGLDSSERPVLAGGEDDSREGRGNPQIRGLPGERPAERSREAPEGEGGGLGEDPGDVSWAPLGGWSGRVGVG
ncbi:putative ASF1 anti-silencing function 1 like protein [Cryptosporidium canis]|nr:putative ASF1 anti-silencing function 1 like protein [Cryptosporidium canis]